MSAWQRLPRIQLTTSRSRSYLPPCLVARAGRKHLPVVTPKSHTRRSVTKVPTFGPRKSVRSTGPVGGILGALVVNLTCEVRRVAKLPSEPRGDAYQIRQAKYVDSSHSNTRTSQGALGQGVSALQNTLVQKHCEILPYPCPTWSRTFPPPHLEPKAPQKHLISKCPNPSDKACRVHGKTW